MSEDTPSTEALTWLQQIEWLVYFARKSKGTIAEVAARALEQNPYLRQEAADTSGLPEALDAALVQAFTHHGARAGDNLGTFNYVAEVARDAVRAALRGATERPLDGACNDPACAYREEVRLGRLVPVEVVRATERRATETLSAIVVAVGGEVRVPDRVVVAGSSLRVEPDPVSHETVYHARLASPTTTTPETEG